MFKLGKGEATHLVLPTEILSAKSCLPVTKLSHVASRWYMDCRKNAQES